MTPGHCHRGPERGNAGVHRLILLPSSHIPWRTLAPSTREQRGSPMVSSLIHRFNAFGAAALAFTAVLVFALAARAHTTCVDNLKGERCERPAFSLASADTSGGRRG